MPPNVTKCLLWGKNAPSWKLLLLSRIRRWVTWESGEGRPVIWEVRLWKESVTKHNFSRVRSVYKGWFSITHISHIFLYQEEETLLDTSGAPWHLYQPQFYQRNRTSRRHIYSTHNDFMLHDCGSPFNLLASKSKVPGVDCKDRRQSCSP